MPAFAWQKGSMMLEALTPEQVLQIISEIEAWKERHVEVLAEEPESQQQWHEATLVRFEQLYEIESMECYLVVLQFENYTVTYPLRRENNRLIHLSNLTYYAPEFTHPLQGK